MVEAYEAGDVSRFEHDRQVLVVERFAALPGVAQAERGTFLIVHGLGMGRSAYRDVAHQLRAYGDVITVDLPGFGEAPEPPRTPTMQRLGDLVAAFVRSADLPHLTLIGHSMGTQVVSWAAVRHPGLAEDVVLVAPTVDASARTVLKQAWRLITGLGDMHPSTILLGAREYLRAGPHVIRKTRAAVYDRAEDAYRKLEVPVLVIRGAHDRVVTAPWADEVMVMVPHAMFEEVPGRGHGTILRDSADIARSIAVFARDVRDGEITADSGDRAGEAGSPDAIDEPAFPSPVDDRAAVGE